MAEDDNKVPLPNLEDANVASDIVPVLNRLGCAADAIG